MPGIDSDTKLMLHCNGDDGSTSFPDVSDSEHTINVTATAEVDTAQSKWGGASALFDGDSGYLSADDSADWDICASNSDDWTIDFQVKHTDHVGVELYINQFENADELWAIWHVHEEGLRFLLRYGATNMIYPAGGGEIADTNWHHIAFCKVGSEYGLYKDGTQVSYISDADTHTFTGSLYIGARGDPNYYFDGHMDEIRIQHSNIFEAAPNDTPDNTITVPTCEYTRDLSISVSECLDLDEKLV